MRWIKEDCSSDSDSDLGIGKLVVEEDRGDPEVGGALAGMPPAVTNLIANGMLRGMVFNPRSDHA